MELKPAHYLHKIIPDLVRVHENTKFILTVREPISWLESEINANFRSKPGGIWEKLENLRYDNRSPMVPTPENSQKYDLSVYLKCYKYHINQVVDNVPKNKLLILNTLDIFQKLKKFVGNY